MQALQERIRPSANLRNQQCREEREAVIITVNGRGDTVFLGNEEYNRMKARIELLEILAEGEEDVRAGRIASIKDTFADLRTILKE